MICGRIQRLGACSAKRSGIILRRTSAPATVFSIWDAEPAKTHFTSSAGVRVSAYDASPEMVRAARERGVAANVVALEEIDRIDGIFDGRAFQLRSGELCREFG